MKTSVYLSIYQDLLREFNESNGNGSIPIASSTQPNQSVEIGSTAEEPTEQSANSDTRNNDGTKEKTPGQGCGLSSVKDASRRAASVFHVENPHNIDRHARTVFPTAFLFVNILYWLYYLFLWEPVPNCCINSPSWSCSTSSIETQYQLPLPGSILIIEPFCITYKKPCCPTDRATKLWKAVEFPLCITLWIIS